MIRKHVLSEEQKKYLIYYHDVPFSYLKKHLEVIHRDDNSLWSWELCDGSRSLGYYFTEGVIEQLIAREESKIQYSDIANAAEPGDKLRGKFYVDAPGIIDPRKSVSEIIFHNNIYQLLNNGDVKEGARYFVKKLEDNTYKTYVIIEP